LGVAINNGGEGGAVWAARDRLRAYFSGVDQPGLR
jgi:hypothetical protein